MFLCHNIVTKETEKQVKHLILAAKISRMWKLKTTIFPLVGDLGLVTNNLQRNLARMSGNVRLLENQEVAMCGTQSWKLRRHHRIYS